MPTRLGPMTLGPVTGRWWHRTWELAALVAALSVSAIGVTRGTYAAGGSDSYCYVSQASSWLDGSALRPQVVDFKTPWPNAPTTLAPAGYVPSPHVAGAIAPICPPGFGLVMAAANAAGGMRLVYALVPIFGGVLVWCAFLWGRALASSMAGVCAAVLTATSPIVLYQVVQPMSDIPAAASWMAALAALLVPSRPRLLTAGVCASGAILIRPNLAPAVLVVIGAAAWHRPANLASCARRLGWLALGATPIALLTAWAHAAVYGSPIRAGYGSLDQLFDIAHVGPNLERYARWLTETHTPLIWLAPLAVWFAWSRSVDGFTAKAIKPDTDHSRRRHVAIAVSFVSVVVAVYLPYTVFEDWWYLRFLLPAIPLVWVLAVDAVSQALGRGSELALRLATRLRKAPTGRRAAAPPGGRSVEFITLVALGCVSVFVAAQQVRNADERDAFDLWRSEARFVTTAEVAARVVPPRGVVWSAFHSGNIRLYGGRQTILWDSLPRDWLDRAVQSLGDEGRESYLALDSFEEPRFRAQFEGASEYGSLDWPPRVQVGNAVKIWAFGDREPFRAGQPPSTERVAAAPRRPGPTPTALMQR